MFGFGLIGLVFVIIVIVLLTRSRNGGTGSASEDRALTILRERYARGEIDKTEFDARKRDLS